MRIKSLPYLIACTWLALPPTALAAPAAAEAAESPPHSPGIESADYVWNQDSPEKQQALARTPDLLQGKIAYEVCQGCHLPDGSGKSDALYPALAGQHASVLIKQMVDVRAGQRDNPTMHPFVGDWVVSTDDIADIAGYLSQLPAIADNGLGDGARLAAGQALYDKDCASCHGAHGEGSAAKFIPMVAHQHYRYLQREAVLIRDGQRRNANPKMVKAIRHYTDDDIAAVSDYMSRLALPR